MRIRAPVIIAAVLLAACGQQAEQGDTPSAPDPAVSAAQTPAGPSLERQALIGTWSFDGSCASGDGMGLAADGGAFYDEWGSGTWRIDARNQLVLDLMQREMGVEDDPGRPVRLRLDVRGHSDEALELEISGDGDPPRVVTALRCS